MQNRAEFSKFMLMIAEIFGKTLSEALTEVYWETLKPFTDEQCKKAFGILITSSQFFPKPVDLLEKIHGNQGEKAIIAWEKTYKAIRQVGSYESVKFDDPAIHSTIELMGGWVELCKMKTDEAKWKQLEFEKIYKVMVKKDKHPESLAGRVEIENSARGFNDNVPKQIFIGGEGALKQKLSGSQKKGTSLT